MFFISGNSLKLYHTRGRYVDTSTNTVLPGGGLHNLDAFQPDEWQGSGSGINLFDVVLIQMIIVPQRCGNCFVRPFLSASHHELRQGDDRLTETVDHPNIKQK